MTARLMGRCPRRRAEARDKEDGGFDFDSDFVLSQAEQWCVACSVSMDVVLAHDDEAHCQTLRKPFGVD